MPLLLTGVVAGVLGAVLGVVGLVAVVPQLSPSAATVSHDKSISTQVKPSEYGTR
jgi:hypothetical protein